MIATQVPEVSVTQIQKLAEAVLMGCKDPRIINALRQFAPLVKQDFEAEPVVVDEDGRGHPLHQGQREVWIAEWRIIAVFAGWQSGKTTMGPFWLRREIIRRGAGLYAVISPHAPMLEASVLPQLQAIFSEPLWTYSGAKGGSFTMTPLGELVYFGSRQRIRTRIITRHAQDPKAVESWTAKGIWVDEPGQISNAIWPSIQARAMRHQARILLTSRPYEFNWYVTEIWNRCMTCYGDPEVDPWIRREDAPPDMGVVNFATDDSPNEGNRIEAARQQQRLAPWEYRMKYQGIPTRPAGLVYTSFVQRDRPGRKSNVVNFYDFFPGGVIPPEWPIWVGVDFGTIHTAFVLIAEEMRRNVLGDWVHLATPRFCVFKTYLATKQEDPLEHMRQAFRGFGQPVKIINAQGKEETVFQLSRRQIFAFGGSHQETAWRERYAKHGLEIGEPVISGNSTIGAQVSTTWSAFNSQRLLVCDHEKDFIMDLETMSVELDKETNEPVATEKIKDEAKFHRPAALRYVVPALPIWEDQAAPAGSNIQGVPSADRGLDPDVVFHPSMSIIDDDPRSSVDDFDDPEEEPEVRISGIPGRV